MYSAFESASVDVLSLSLFFSFAPKAGSGFTGGAVGKNPRSLQHGLPAGRLFGHIVVEPPQTFLDTQYIGVLVEWIWVFCLRYFIVTPFGAENESHHSKLEQRWCMLNGIAIKQSKFNLRDLKLD